VELLAAINQVAERLQRNRRIRAGVALALGGMFSLCAGVVLANWSGILGGVVVVTGVGVTALVLKRAGTFKTISLSEAASELDLLLGTKDRAVAYLELLHLGATGQSASGEKELRSKQELIQSQCAQLLQGFIVEIAIPFVWSRKLKWMMVGIAGCLALLIAVLINRSNEQFLTPQAQAVAQLIEANPEMPAKVQEALQDLAQQLEQESLGDENASVAEALENATKEIAKAEAEIAAAKNLSSADTKPKAEVSADPRKKVPPTATPTPTPTPRTEQSSSAPSQGSSSEASPSAAQQEQQEQGKGGAGREKPKEGQNADGAKKQDGAQGGTSSGEQQGEGKEKKQGEQGSGEGAQDGKESQQQAGEQGSDKQQQGESGQGKSEKGSASSKGEKSEKGESQDGDGDSGNQGQGGQSGEKQKQDGGQQGDSGATQGLQAAQQKVDELKQQREGSQQQKQGGNKSAGAQSGAGGGKSSGQQSSAQNNSAGDGAGDRPGESKGRPEGAASSRNAGGKEGQGASQSSKSDQSAEKQNQGNTNKDSGDAGGAKGGPGGQAKRFEEGEGKWPGLGDNKEFKDAEIAAQESSVDPNFVGSDTKIERNSEQAKFKVALPELSVAKPDTVKKGEEQPIPLEYRDLF
jgi:hypothetical protein